MSDGVTLRVQSLISREKSSFVGPRCEFHPTNHPHDARVDIQDEKVLVYDGCESPKSRIALRFLSAQTPFYVISRNVDAYDFDLSPFTDTGSNASLSRTLATIVMTFSTLNWEVSSSPSSSS